MSESPAPTGRHVATKPHGRRRAEDPTTDPGNIKPLTESIPIVRPRERRAALELERQLLEEVTQPQRAIAAVATTGLVMISAMSGGIATAATSDLGQSAPETGTNTIVVPDPEPEITASPTAAVKHAKVTVKTKAAPPPPPPPPVVVVAEEVPPVVAEPVPEPLPIVQAPAATPAPVVATPTPAPSAAGTKQAAIANAALAQLGVFQDCTMLVTNSLAAVGINFHDWPVGYFSLGHQVSASQAVAGDLIYYADGGMGMAHIAVYLGDGVAVHGGWNGNQTITYSVNVGSGPVFIRVS